MPRVDRTGPMGEGPMTGLRRGDCADSNTTSGFGGFGFGFGRGAGRGFGFGRGMGMRFNPSPGRTETESGLKSLIALLKEQLQSLENRLQNMKTEE